MRKFFAENALILTFFALFVLCLGGQAAAGHAVYNDMQRTHGLPPLAMAAYVTTGEFLQGMMENWQAAILQLAMLILLGKHLRQRGAPHSKRLGAGGGGEEQEESGHPGAAEPGRVEWKPPHAGPGGGWLHRNSLSLAFFSLFAVTFVAHALVGAAAYKRQQMLAGQPVLSVPAYVGSASFWFLTMQTWEAEFMAMALYLFLSIYLRQEGSPESKAPDAPDNDTGHPNP